MIIAFGNKARHGKDSAGEALVAHYNNARATQQRHGLKPATPEARIFKFADALYRVCREEYGMTEKDPALLQKIGDGRRQEFGLTYWIDQLDAQISKFNGIAVITDMRYTNEAEWVKSKGGITVQVLRLNLDGNPYVSPDRDPNFISEVQLDTYDYDVAIETKSAVLTGELAITIAEYYRGMMRA